MQQARILPADAGPDATVQLRYPDLDGVSPVRLQRWIAEVLELPGAMSYAPTRDEAIARAKALALRAMAEQLEHGEARPDLESIAFRAA